MEEKYKEVIELLERYNQKQVLKNFEKLEEIWGEYHVYETPSEE